MPIRWMQRRSRLWLVSPRKRLLERERERGSWLGEWFIATNGGCVLFRSGHGRSK
jgi:hypothetical protein